MPKVGTPPEVVTVMTSLNTTSTFATSPALKVLLTRPVLDALKAKETMVGTKVSVGKLRLRPSLPALPAAS